MTWLLKIKRRAQNAVVAWLDLGVERPKHKRPSGDLLRDHSNDDDLDDWPGAIEPGGLPWRSAEPVSLPGDEGWVDDTDHQAWLRSMTDPQTPDEIRRASIGAERLRAAMHEQAQVEADAFLRSMTDGGGER